MRFWFWPFLTNTYLCVFVKKWHSEELINENETKQRRDERNTVQPVVTVDVHNLTSRGRSATSLPKTQNSVLSPFSYNHLLDEDQYSLSNQCREI